jgi:hypothetical protein
VQKGSKIIRVQLALGLPQRCTALHAAQTAGNAYSSPFYNFLLFRRTTLEKCAAAFRLRKHFLKRDLTSERSM